MFKAFKFRIYPNKNQSALIDKTIDCARFIYNKMLEDKIANYEKNKSYLYVTPSQYREKFDFLCDVDSLALANAKINLETAYTKFFSNPNYGYPKFKSKKNSKMSYTTTLINNNIRLENGMIRLPKVGFVKLKQHRLIPESYTLKSCTISKTYEGKYFVSIRYQYEPIIEERPVDTVVGLKVFENNLITSDNETFSYPTFVNKTFKNYEKQLSKQSKMQHGSKNFRKQRRRVNKLREKLSNQCGDYLHKTTRQIANAYDCVVVENVKSEGENKNKKDYNIIPNYPINFSIFLAYKLEELGKKFLTIEADKLPIQASSIYIKNIALKMLTI